MRDCMIWQGTLNANGYGVFTRKRRQIKAHRAAYEAARGPIPEGLCVLHKCDVRACVNPEHLFLGTRIDNQKDMAAKGRAARGERNGACKLSDAKVPLLRFNYALGGVSQRTLAYQFGVSQSLVSQIVTGRIR